MQQSVRSSANTAQITIQSDSEINSLRLCYRSADHDQPQALISFCQVYVYPKGKAETGNKMIWGMKRFIYEERLKALDVGSLGRRGFRADMIEVWKTKSYYFHSRLYIETG